MIVLGIESSCDETAAAIVEDGQQVRSSVVYSQIAAHRPYGGVVPEIASRAHVDVIAHTIQSALDEAQVHWSDIDQIAVTRGPGLASSLLVGATAAQALAARTDIPLYAINHLDGHVYSVFLSPEAPTPDQACPLVVLLVTGGHTMLVRVDSLSHFHLLGQTLDDAVGEALDKGATLLGLGYPGGPEIEKAAATGRPDPQLFPRGLQGSRGTVSGGLPRDRCFSFSGLKTALLYWLRDQPNLPAEADLADVAASYQEAAFAALLDRLERTVKDEGVMYMACVGGVAKNRRLRAQLETVADRLGVQLLVAPMPYCTDNAAMIAGIAGARTLAGIPLQGLEDIQPSAPLGA